MSNQPNSAPAAALRACDRRVVLKAAAAFSAMAALGGRSLVARAQEDGETASPTTLAGKWIEAEQVGDFASASDARVFQADFWFYACAPHWGPDGPEDALVEMSFGADGVTWSDPVTVGWAWEDAGRPDRGGRYFGQLVFPEGGANHVRYRTLDVAGDPLALPELAFTYLDASEGPTVDDLFTASAVSPSIDPPPIVSRANWGANEAYRHEDQNLAKPIIWPPDYQTVEHVIIHHTETPNFRDPLLEIRSIYYYHAIERGWGDIGYNFLVDYTGKVYEGRFGGENVVGGHAYQYAYGSAGIGTIGSFSSVEPTEDALAALVWITAWAGRRLDPWDLTPFHDYPNFPAIASHRDTMPTACPGDMLYAELRDIRNAVVEVLSYTSPDPEPDPAPFAIGDTVQVIVQDAAQRAGPGLSFTRLRSLNVGDRFTISDGPVANDDFVWYSLDGARGVGWSAASVLEKVTGGPPPEFEVDDIVIVDTDVLNLRASPSTSGTIITTLVRNDRGTVLDGPVAANGYNWYKLQTNKGTGWCVSAYLKKSSGPTPQGLDVGASVTVDTDLLNLRDQPSTSADVVAVLPFGARLTITDEAESADGYDWYPVRNATYGEGWCAGAFLSPASSAGDTISIGDEVRVIDGELNLRASPGLDAGVLAVLPDGQTLTVIAGPIEEDAYTWFEVRGEQYGDGWCAGEYLEVV